MSWNQMLVWCRCRAFSGFVHVLSTAASSPPLFVWGDRGCAYDVRVRCRLHYLCLKIAFRETVTRHTEFAYTHEEQGQGKDARTRHGTDRANADDRRQVQEEPVAMVLLS